MATVTALLDAIHDKFINDVTLVAALPNGLWHVEADKETAFLYGTYQLITDVPEYDFQGQGSPLEFASIQFNLYDDKLQSDTAIKTAFDALLNLYDEVLLTVTGHSFLRMHRINGFIDRDDESNWRAVIEYEVIIQRS